MKNSRGYLEGGSNEQGEVAGLNAQRREDLYRGRGALHLQVIAIEIKRRNMNEEYLSLRLDLVDPDNRLNVTGSDNKSSHNTSPGIPTHRVTGNPGKTCLHFVQVRYYCTYLHWRCVRVPVPVHWEKARQWFGCGSVSEFDPDTNGLANPDCETGSGSRQAKIVPQKGKN